MVMGIERVREISSASKWHNTIFVSSRDASGEFAFTQGVHLCV